MSKSKGNVVDPVILEKRYGVDALRYFLLREVPFGSDGVFSNEALVNRINSDLANDLGNLVSRSVAMVERYFDGYLPVPGEPEALDKGLIDMAVNTSKKVEGLMEDLLFSNALGEIWKLIGRSNKYIDETMPWVLAKSEEDRPRLGTVLYNLADTLRIIGILISPFMPSTPGKIFSQLGIEGSDGATNWSDTLSFRLLTPGTRLKKREAIFPRLDIKKELESLEKSLATDTKEVPAIKIRKTDNDNDRDKGEKSKMQEISIDDFLKLDLRIAKVLEAERVEKSQKLLRLQLELGKETRQVVSGIAEFYSPEDLVGKNLILVANLKPVKLMGNLSEGMILAASDDEDSRLVLATIDGEIESGSKVS